MASWWGGVRTCVPWQGFCGVGWHCGGAHVWWVGTMARFSQGGLAPKLAMHAMLGQCWSSVVASLVHCDRVVAADLCMAKGGGRGHSLCAVRWWGLARLEGWSEKEQKKEKK